LQTTSNATYYLDILVSPRLYFESNWNGFREAVKHVMGVTFEQDAGFLHLMVSIGAIGGVPSPARDLTDHPEVSKRSL